MTCLPQYRVVQGPFQHYWILGQRPWVLPARSMILWMRLSTPRAILSRGSLLSMRLTARSTGGVMNWVPRSTGLTKKLMFRSLVGGFVC